MKKVVIITFLLSCISLIYAQTELGSVVLFQGNIKIKNKNSIKKQKVTVGSKIFAGDLLISSPKSSAKINLIDGSTLTIDASSTILFHSLEKAAQNSGKVLYKIAKRNAKHALKIKTPFAIIGIKGTTFIVDSTKSASVLLKEGRLSIESIKKEFQLYRKKVATEFEAFKAADVKKIQQEKDAFEAYKRRENGNYEKVKVVKEFELTAGNRISFSKNSVKEDLLQDDAEFQYFETLEKAMQ